jgi:hypothetical protein
MLYFNEPFGGGWWGGGIEGTLTLFRPGLPDFSWYTLPKREEIYQMTRNCMKGPNCHKIYQTAIKYTKSHIIYQIDIKYIYKMAIKYLYLNVPFKRLP